MDYNSAALKIFDLFNRNAVEYLVVGGTAVSYYGKFRKSINDHGQVVDTPDIDLWYNPNYKNYFNLLDAVEQLGKDVTEYRDDPTPDPKNSVFKLNFTDYKLDLLPGIVAFLNFRECYARKTVVQIDGVEIPFISLVDLIRDKEALGRPKDFADIENLRKNNPALYKN